MTREQSADNAPSSSLRPDPLGGYMCDFCHHPGEDCCPATVPGQYGHLGCTRADGHEGPHVACGSGATNHPMATS